MGGRFQPPAGVYFQVLVDSTILPCTILSTLLAGAARMALLYRFRHVDELLQAIKVLLIVPQI